MYLIYKCTTAENGRVCARNFCGVVRKRIELEIQVIEYIGNVDPQSTSHMNDSFH